MSPSQKKILASLAIGKRIEVVHKKWKQQMLAVYHPLYNFDPLKKLGILNEAKLDQLLCEGVEITYPSIVVCCWPDQKGVIKEAAFDISDLTLPKSPYGQS